MDNTDNPLNPSDMVFVSNFNLGDLGIKPAHSVLIHIFACRCDPSWKVKIQSPKMAYYTGMSERTISRLLSELREMGWLDTTHEFNEWTVDINPARDILWAQLKVWRPEVANIIAKRKE